jgi:hypothetical protein
MCTNNYKKKILMKLSISLFFASIIISSPVGNGAQAQEGVAFKGKARIYSIQVDPDRQYILLVQMIPSSKNREKIINVFIDKNTINGLTEKKIAIKDFKAGMAVMIEGTKFVEYNGNKKIIIIMATRITPLVE